MSKKFSNFAHITHFLPIFQCVESRKYPNFASIEKKDQRQWEATLYIYETKIPKYPFRQAKAQTVGECSSKTALLLGCQRVRWCGGYVPNHVRQLQQDKDYNNIKHEWTP